MYKFVALVIAIFIVIVVALTFPHFIRNEYTVTVTEKERVMREDSSKYLVFTELQNGASKVFQVTDTLLEFKFNSSDRYAKLKEGETYKIKTYGLRFGLFSWYENIVFVEAA